MNSYLNGWCRDIVCLFFLKKSYNQFFHCNGMGNGLSIEVNHGGDKPPKLLVFFHEIQKFMVHIYGSLQKMALG